MEVPMKRKRGRPRKSETSTLRSTHHSPPPLLSETFLPIHVDPPHSRRPEDELYGVGTKISRSYGGGDEMVGRVISGVVEASFEEGYLLNVQLTSAAASASADDDDDDSRRRDSCCFLRGVVFRPDKVDPITITNDVAPNAKMYQRKEMTMKNHYGVVVYPPHHHTTSVTTSSEPHIQQYDHTTSIQQKDASCHTPHPAIENELNESCANGDLKKELGRAPPPPPPLCSNKTSSSFTPSLVPSLFRNCYTIPQVDDDDDQLVAPQSSSGGFKTNEMTLNDDSNNMNQLHPPQTCTSSEEQYQILTPQLINQKSTNTTHPLYNSTTYNADSNLNLELNQPPPTTSMETALQGKLIDMFPTTCNNEVMTREYQNRIDELNSCKENAQLEEKHPKQLVEQTISMALGRTMTTTQGIIVEDQTMTQSQGGLTLAIQESTFISEIQK